MTQMREKRAATDRSDERLTRRHMLKVAAALTVLAPPPCESMAVDLRKRLQPIARRRSGDSPLKRRARSDYQASLSQFGGRLASPARNLKRAAVAGELLDVLIVGSGYGGAITAARVSQNLRPGKRVAILERGREWLPGNFPDSLRNAVKELRYGFVGKRAQKRRRNQLGLFEYTSNPDINVIAGSGLGGTSLINANVAAMPEADIFARDVWPTALRNRDALQPFFDLAECELNIQTSPGGSDKANAFRHIAQAVTETCGGTIYPTKVAANVDRSSLSLAGCNRQGMAQTVCNFCGDCTTGCNVGAKNSLQMNYLPVARQNGTEMYDKTEVEFIEKSEHGYVVHFKQYANCGTQEHVFCGRLNARVVILAAGSLGSTAILLRSQEHGLQLSNRVGHQFTGNGNVIGIMTGSERKTNSAGIGAYANGLEPIGLAQQLNLDLSHHQRLVHRMLVQEGAVPRAYATAVGGMLQDINLRRTLLFLATGHDGADGRIIFRDGRPRVTWANHGANGYLEYARKMVESLSPIGGGRHRQLAISGGKPSTVHPLGGCAMADDANHGVVTDAGEVFSSHGHADTLTHPGLNVADGSVIPTSLGVNPLLTIAAVSERIAAKLVSNPDFEDLFG
jgi:cholesterol oxidase